MKVIHLISGGDSGGARTHVHLLLKHLNRDMEATLVCFMDGPFAAEARELGIPTIIIDKNLPATLRELKKLIRQGGYDIMHCHGSRGNLMGSLLKRSCGLPLVSTVHSDPRLDYMGRPLAAISYGVLNAMALRRMDFHIGVSHAMRDTLISRRFDANRIFAIYNGVEFEGISEGVPGEREDFFRSLGLDWPADSIVVGIAARFHPVKDVPTLLRGFAKARKTDPRLRLLIAGDGQDRASLEALAAELGLGSDCCFAGWQTDVERFYRCLDINTLCSLSETFPYALTEGARAHLPTVASRVGGVPLLIKDGENGLLFEAGSAEALGAHLASLAADEAERRRLGEALYSTASAGFSAAATAAQQKEIYGRILRTHEAQKRGERRGVLVCGAYGMSNTGDEAILEAILSELRSIDSELPITVLSRQPKPTALKLGVKALHTFNVLAFLRVMRRAKLYINGGGSLIQDVTSTRSLSYYLFTLRAAKRRGCKVLMYGCGIGPVSHEHNRRRTKKILNRYVDKITLRENHSLRELQSYGVTEPEMILSSDPALFIEPAPEKEVRRFMAERGIDPDGRYLCFCLRNWPGYKDKAEIFGRAAAYGRDRYGLTPLFLAINHSGDGAAGALAARHAGPGAVQIDEAMSSAMTVGLISRMQAVVGMRLHSLIFSASQSVPVAGVSYDPKVFAFMDYIGLGCHVDYNAADFQALCSIIDSAMATDRAALQASTEAIKAIEDRNRMAARELLGL